MDVPPQPNESSPEHRQASPAPSSQESVTSERDSYPMHLYGRPSKYSKSPLSSDVEETHPESFDWEGALPYFTVSQIMSGSNLAKPNSTAHDSKSSTPPAAPASSRSSVSYVEPYIPLSLLTSATTSTSSSSTSSPVYASPVTFETFHTHSSSSTVSLSTPPPTNPPLPPTFSLIHSAMAPLAPSLLTAPPRQTTPERKSEADSKSNPTGPPSPCVLQSKCTQRAAQVNSESSDNIPVPMPLLKQSSNWVARKESENVLDKSSLRPKPNLPNLSVDKELNSISKRKPMPPPRPPSLSLLPPTLAVFPPTPPATPGTIIIKSCHKSPLEPILPQDLATRSP